MIVLSIDSSPAISESGACRRIPQYGQKASASVTGELHSGHVTGFSVPNLLFITSQLPINVKPQKRLPDDYLVGLAQDLRTPGQQPPASIKKRAVSRPEILDHVYISAIGYSCVPARYLCIRIVRVEVDVGENTIVGIPSPDIRLLGGQLELGIGGVTTFDHQAGMCPALRFWLNLLSLLREFKRLIGDRRNTNRSYLRRPLAGIADLGLADTCIRASVCV